LRAADDKIFNIILCCKQVFPVIFDLNKSKITDLVAFLVIFFMDFAKSKNISTGHQRQAMGPHAARGPPV
jgi:hypothetical protein